MVLFFITVTFYGLSLLLYKQSPDSLKAKPLTLQQNFDQIKASFFIGIILLGIFFITSNFEFTVVNEEAYTMFALFNNDISLALLPLQLISHSFIHFDFMHLISNVSGIGVASIYERRVGPKRFLKVLVIGCLISTLSIFFYPKPTSSCGISGGVFSLAAAYFIDYKDLTFKEYVHALVAFVFLMVLFSVAAEVETAKNAHVEKLHYQIDHIGHVLGALGGIIYCRFLQKL